MTQPFPYSIERERERERDNNDNESQRLLGVYILTTLEALLLLIIRQCGEIGRSHDQPHFTDEETEAQSGDILACPRSHSWTWTRTQAA